MLNLATLEWIDSIVFSRDIVSPGERNAFFNRVKLGEFLALRRGAYVRSSEWNSLDRDAQQRLRIKAAVAYAGRDFVVSHQSAVAMWRLPWIGPRTTATHVLSDFSTGGRSSRVLVRHNVGLPERIERIEGLRVTSIARTVADVLCESTFEQSVVVADAALHRSGLIVAGSPDFSVSLHEIRSELANAVLRHGTARASRAIEFADGASESPGESLSRVNIALAHLSPPELQAGLVGASGRRWFVDFWWPKFNVIGEFDGDAKYSDPRFLGGRTPERALLDEKDREDDLRAAGHAMSRWGWKVATSMPALRDQLVRAGVR
jgi:hypothetical protein